MGKNHRFSNATGCIVGKEIKGRGGERNQNRAIIYSMFQLVCSIIRQHNSRSNRDNLILKKKTFSGNSLAFYDY